MIFGGQGLNTYVFQQSDVTKGVINVKQMPMRSGFKKETGFCGGNDSVIKSFN
jgi:hypothetical protein